MATTYISIHSLRMEGDGSSNQRYIDVKHFNPLPPHGGRPGRVQCAVVAGDISIHSLRMEGDFTICTMLPPGHISIHSLRMEGDPQLVLPCDPVGNFNPLPPHGGRQFAVHEGVFECLFQSTPSAWRETCGRLPIREVGAFHFNPLPPHGGRPYAPRLRVCAGLFQSTPSAWRETTGVSEQFGILRHFNPLPPHGGRPVNAGYLQ